MKHKELFTPALCGDGADPRGAVITDSNRFGIVFNQAGFSRWDSA